MEALEADTVVVGASAAGLSVAAALQRAGLESLVVERTECVGTAWRNHYERLHLHTPRSASGLPFFPMPKSYPRYPTRAQVVDYLEAYGKHFDIKPRYGETVDSIARTEDGRWRTRGSSASITSANVVVATGYTHTPVRPVWPGMDSFPGSILHSSEYKNGAPFKGKKVLVVGFGNSACEIALCLHEHGASPSMAVRSPVNVLPRDFLGIPALTFGILLSKLPARVGDALSLPMTAVTIGSLRKYGLKKLAYGPITQIKKHAKIPLLDLGTMRLIKQGQIRVFPGIERFETTTVVFEDRSEEDFDAVVLGTGYHPAVAEFIDDANAVTDDAGIPTRSGTESTLPGLYFCGFNVPPSGMLREIAIEAKRIAKAIGTRRELAP